MIMSIHTPKLNVSRHYPSKGDGWSNRRIRENARISSEMRAVAEELSDDSTVSYLEYEAAAEFREPLGRALKDEEVKVYFSSWDEELDSMGFTIYEEDSFPFVVLSSLMELGAVVCHAKRINRWSVEIGFWRDGWLLSEGS